MLCRCMFYVGTFRCWVAKSGLLVYIVVLCVYVMYMLIVLYYCVLLLRMYHCVFAYVYICRYCRVCCLCYVNRVFYVVVCHAPEACEALPEG